MEAVLLPKYNYPPLGLSCHWHAICQQLSACRDIIKSLLTNEASGIIAVDKRRRELMDEYKTTQSAFRKNEIRKEIERLTSMPASRKLLIQTLFAPHDDEEFNTYCDLGRGNIAKMIYNFYDIDIRQFGYIMEDIAKIYDMCLKYYVPREILYVSTSSYDTNTAVNMYKPRYICIPSTELRANLEKDICGYKYKLISISKGSGHFYCDHIRDDIAYRFDDRTPKNVVIKHSVDDILKGIKANERITRVKKRYLRDEVIEELGLHGMTREELSDEGKYKAIEQRLKSKGIDLSKDLNKEDVLRIFADDAFIVNIVKNLKDTFGWRGIGTYMESVSNQYYSDEFFMTEEVDSTFYGMAMLVRIDN